MRRARTLVILIAAVLLPATVVSAAPPTGASEEARGSARWSSDGARWPYGWGLTNGGRLGNTDAVRGPGGKNAIRIVNHGGGRSGDRWGFDGRMTFAALGMAPQNEAYLRYRVWFPQDYEWDTQGKMPGLQGVIPGGSVWLANDSKGCGRCYDDRQFGARTMWKGQRMMTYLNVAHAAGRDTRRGQPIYVTYDGAGLRPGWNTVEQHVKLNTPGRNDGVFEGWVNGERGVRLTDVQYRTRSRADLRITQWNLVHFWGGGAADYPERATAVYYADVAVSRSRIGG